MKMGVWTGLLLFGGGACLVVGFVYFGIAIRWARSRTHLWLALLGFLGAATAVAEARMYMATTPAAYAAAMKWQLGLSVLWGVSLTRFLSVYVDGLKRSAVVVSAGLVAAVVANSVSPAGIIYSEITALPLVTLPWGEQIALGQGPSNPLRLLLDGSGVLLTAFSIAACVRAARHKTRRQTALLALTLGMLLSTGFLHAALVDLGILELPYLTTPVICLAVFMLSADLAVRVAETFTLNRTIVANERRWRSLVDNARLLIVGIDREGRIEFANPHLERVTGYSAEEIVGRSFLELVPAADREERARLFSEAIAEGPKPSAEVAVRTRGSGDRLVVWRSVRLHDEEGVPSGLLSIGADVTDRRRAEEARDLALAELEELRRQLEEENLYLRQEIKSGHDFEEIIGESAALREVLHKVAQVAPLDTTIVIQGETGVGKELIARAIHERSPRSARPFVRVNCGAFAATLIESEIFGHEAGAFTGARGARKGRFEVADGGTLLLDEIGELPLELQPKLLRVLQAGEYERVGSSEMRRADVRVLAATHRDLRAEVKEGRFREDLYYRLNVYPLTVPPLRERREDIPLLVHHFAPRLGARAGKSFENVPGPVMNELVEYDWPGNVRELLNILERAVITSPGPALRLPDRLRTHGVDSLNDPGSNGHLTMAEAERRHIVATLEATGWRISGPKGAAKILALNPSTLRSRMRKLGIERSPTRPEGS